MIVGSQYHQLNIIDLSSNKGHHPINEAWTKVSSRNWIVSGLVKAEIKVANQGDQLNKFYTIQLLHIRSALSLICFLIKAFESLITLE